MKRWIAIAMVVGLTSAACWAASAWADKNIESKRELSASPVKQELTDAKQNGLIVHEWGTFTSFSGSNGIRLEFRPLLDSDLPPFVLDRAQHGGDIFSKRNYRAFVRMETPVTYFYTDRPRTVRVRVAFPEGLLTEFYPPVETITPEYGREQELVKDTALDWGQVQLIPESYLNGKLTGELATLINGRTINELLPQQGTADVAEHYFYARETDSALVHAHRTAVESRPFTPTGDFFEKFLFYRGLGSFSLPLEVEGLGQNQFTVTNKGSDDLSWFMVLNVNEGGLHFGTFDGVTAGQTRRVSLMHSTSGAIEFEDELEKALVAEGLYEKEAKAMIKTWRSSWFGEQGTRVLYMVPRRLTDEMLPLAIEPRPETTVRVLVGRLDLMTPEAEAAALEIVQRSAVARAEAQNRAKEQNTELEYPLPDEIQKLGRFAEPALARVYVVATDPVIQQEAANLLDQLSASKAVSIGL